LVESTEHGWLIGLVVIAFLLITAVCVFLMRAVARQQKFFDTNYDHLMRYNLAYNDVQREHMRSELELQRHNPTAQEVRAIAKLREQQPPMYDENVLITNIPGDTVG
jgi:hypothetical protein